MPTGPETPKSRILLVEDSVPQAFALRRLLLENGYEVTVASQGMEALEHLKSNPVDLVISDVEMPVMDGFETCRHIKSNPAWNHLPVVLLTGLSNPENVLLGLAAGSDYYLTKPFAPKFLLRRIGEILEQRDFGVPSVDEDVVEVVIHAKPVRLKPARRQMLNLLLSTYECAVEQNRELIRVQTDLNELNQALREQKKQLELSERNLRDANKLLEELAKEDGLTGLRNHRAFKERLEEEVLRSTRYQLPLSLILLDVDNFKHFNDNFGHPAGDDVLRSVSRILESQVRNTDLVARYGGEEFVVLLPNTTEVESMTIAERIRKAVEKSPWDKRAITLSLGVSGLCSSVANGHALVGLADQALYESKRAGRNRVTNAGTLATSTAK